MPRQANGNIPAHFSELWIRPRAALGISFHRMGPRSLREKMFSLNPTLSEVAHPRDPRAAAQHGQGREEPPLCLAITLQLFQVIT